MAVGLRGGLKDSLTLVVGEYREKSNLEVSRLDHWVDGNAMI